ncbi:unnamed protein product [Penicillium camemberti]|uniref:Str. FM013 n=1 Tax=Penicillium camemberti (strain FM 013) TaxID=1429867 RepID=A0A0G4P1T6_PENC3|nr:unnamed protein product [Penicillium camemberti]
MTLPIPSSNGGHQRQRDGASKSDTTNCYTISQYFFDMTTE